LRSDDPFGAEIGQYHKRRDERRKISSSNSGRYYAGKCKARNDNTDSRYSQRVLPVPFAMTQHTEAAQRREQDPDSAYLIEE
jgi:hypothetical protein